MKYQLGLWAPGLVNQLVGVHWGRRHWGTRSPHSSYSYPRDPVVPSQKVRTETLLCRCQEGPVIPRDIFWKAMRAFFTGRPTVLNGNVLMVAMTILRSRPLYKQKTFTKKTGIEKELHTLQLCTKVNHMYTPACLEIQMKKYSLVKLICYMFVLEGGNVPTPRWTWT